MAVETLHFDPRIRATAEDVRQAQDLVAQAGLPAMLAGWEAEDRQREGKRGARSPFATAEQLLTLLFVLARHKRALTLSNLTALVVTGLTEGAVVQLGLDARQITHRQAYHRLQRAMRRMTATIDPHLEHTDRRRKLSRAEFDRIESEADLERRARNTERMRQFSAAWLLATWLAIPEDVRSRYDGNLAVDGTFIPAFGRHGSYRPSDYVGIEPYAAWYVRDGEHALEPGISARDQAKKKTAWGWEATLAVMVTNDPQRQTTFPTLVLGMTLDQPAREPGANAIRAIEPLHAAGVPAGYLIGDRAYGNTPKPDDFQRPARAMGYGLLYDMKTTDVGQVHMFNGVAMLEGNAYSPSISGHPELVSATADFRAGQIDEQTYYARLQARARLLVQFRTAGAVDGSRQGLCPAAGPNPTVSCPLRPRGLGALGGAARTLLPIRRSAVPSEQAQGPLCSNAGGTAVLRGDVWDRNAMALQYGTREWNSIYRAGRQSIEGRNGVLKGESGPQIAAPGRRRVRGLAALAVLLTTAIAAHNLELIERFMAADVPVDARGRGSTRGMAKRRRDQAWGPLAPAGVKKARAPGKKKASTA